MHNLILRYVGYAAGAAFMVALAAVVAFCACYSDAECRAVMEVLYGWK